MQIIISAVAVIAAACLGFFLNMTLSRRKLQSSENLSARILDEARKEAENIKKEAILQAKDYLLKSKTEFEKESRDKRADLDGLEKRIRSKEENLDKRMDNLAQKESGLENREKGLTQKESQVSEKHAKLDGMIEE